MTDQATRIKEALEPMGYVEQAASDDIPSHITFHRDGWPRPIPVGVTWEDALKSDLRDKSQTGARQEDLFHICGSVLEITMAAPEDDQTAEGFVVSPKHGVWASKYLVGKDINEATGRLWCCVRGIDWPLEDE